MGDEEKRLAIREFAGAMGDLAAPGAGKLTKGMVDLLEAFTSGGQMSRALRRLQEEEWLEERWQRFADEAARKAVELYAKEWDKRPAEERPQPEDARATASRIRDLWESATDRKKRDLLRNALINAFDPALYQEGIVEELLTKLGRLTYPHLIRLREYGASSKEIWRRGEASASAEAYFANELERVGLVAIYVPRENQGSPERCGITDLGRQMLKLLREPPE